MTWYSTQNFFHRLPVSVEERILIWRSDSFDQAVEMGQLASVAYAETAGCSMLDITNCFYLGDDVTDLSNGVELFSLLRDSDLDHANYVAHHFGHPSVGAGESPERDLEGWFAVRSIVAWPDGRAFEERVTGVFASNGTAALAMARGEAEEYVTDVPGRELLDVRGAYRIGDTVPKSGAVIWVNTRPDMLLDVSSYVDSVLDTGGEHTGYLE